MHVYYVHTRVHMHVCENMYFRGMRAYWCMYEHVYMGMHVFLSINTGMCMSMCMCAHGCAHTRWGAHKKGHGASSKGIRGAEHRGEKLWVGYSKTVIRYMKTWLLGDHRGSALLLGWQISVSLFSFFSPGTSSCLPSYSFKETFISPLVKLLTFIPAPGQLAAFRGAAS